MKVVFVLSRLGHNTREFIHVVAESEDYTVNLVKGDEDVRSALQVIRFADRVWFEGVGPLLLELLAGRSSHLVTGAILRTDEEGLAKLPLPDCWKMISDVIVPSLPAAQRLCDGPGPAAANGRIHVIQPDKVAAALGDFDPLHEIRMLAQVLDTPPGDLPKRMWRWVTRIGDICRRRVLLLGRPPQEVIAYLRDCHGCDILIDAKHVSGKVETVLFWEHLSRAGAETAVREALALLEPGGTVALVLPARTGPQNMSLKHARELLSDPRNWQCSMELEADGRCVLASPAGRDENLPVGGEGDVEIVGDWPLVSAVVPVYNDEHRIGRALASLRRQTYRNIEIVVVDDGSTDGTRQAVEKHLDDPRVRYFYKPHSGRPETRNKGVAEARGEYIAWLDSDDEALPNRIALQMAAASEDGRPDIIHADGFFFRQGGLFKERRRYEPFTCRQLPGLLLRGFSAICPILNTSATIRRSLYDRIGLYDPEFLRCQDYDFYVRTAIAGDVKYRHIDAPLVKVHAGPKRWDGRSRALGIYYKLIRKLLSSFSPAQLADPKAQDLQESPELSVSRMVLGLAILYEAPLGHPLFAEVEPLLAKALASPEPTDRAGALNLLGSRAEYAGDEQEARRYYQEALRIAPHLHDARENLRSLGKTQRESSVEEGKHGRQFA